MGVRLVRIKMRRPHICDVCISTRILTNTWTGVDASNRTAAIAIRLIAGEKIAVNLKPSIVQGVIKRP